jgi:hypothetical protein
MRLKRFKKELKQAEGAKTALGRLKLSKIGPKQPLGGQNSKNRPGRLREAKNDQNRSKTALGRPKTAKTRQNTVKYQDFLKSAKFPIAFPIIF